jgi:hypothetical protein
MSDSEVLHPQEPVRTPWTPVPEEQVQKRDAEVADMLRDDAERLEDASPTDLQQAEQGDTPPNATQS